jgi:hypothetical protein
MTERSILNLPHKKDTQATKPHSLPRSFIGKYIR